MIVRYEKHPNGPRLYVSRLRVHHGHVGAVMVALGAWLAWDDRRDLTFRKRLVLPASRVAAVSSTRGLSAGM